MVCDGEAMGFFVYSSDEFGDVGFGGGFDRGVVLHDNLESGVVRVVTGFVASNNWDVMWFYKWQDCI
jgi:hypothetical protein